MNILHEINCESRAMPGLDYSVLQKCMRCGFCLAVCPTYNATKIEKHSPRGRIALARAIADGKMELTDSFAKEIYYCLGCLACASACPAGVQYAEIFEYIRAEVEKKRLMRSWLRRFVRWFTVKWLFMDLKRLFLLGKIIRIYKKWGIQSFLRRSGLIKLLLEYLQYLESLTPDISPKQSADLILPVVSAIGKRRYKVAMLTGCVQDLIFSEINRDTVDVLAFNGCEVITPRNQPCCGSLHVHNGEIELAQQLARRMIDLIPPEEFDAIISNAGGCGSHLKNYGKLLMNDPQYADRARLWDTKLKDIHEWLYEIGIRPLPKHEPGGEQLVTYHDSCHLVHGQKIAEEPRFLLSQIPGLKLIELPESTWCCGSAGIYNITQPEMSEWLLQRKIDNILATGAQTVATANTGCLLQLINGFRKRGVNIRVVHPITLLAEAYRRNAS